MWLTRLDDYQSWLLEAEGARVAIDPWLTEEYTLAPGGWVLRRTRAAPPSGPSLLATVDVLVFCAPFEDHLDPASLEHAPRSIPVLAPPSARRRLRRLGFTDVRSPAPGERVALSPGLEVEVVRSGFPFAGTARGYLWRSDGARLYHEPHAIGRREAAAVGRVDAVLAAVQGVSMLGLPLVMAPGRLVDRLRVLSPRVLVSTGDEPQASQGLLPSLLLRTTGTVEAFRQRLGAEPGLHTRLERLEPGERLLLAPLEARSTAA